MFLPQSPDVAIHGIDEDHIFYTENEILQIHGVTYMLLLKWQHHQMVA